MFHNCDRRSKADLVFSGQTYAGSKLDAHRCCSRSNGGTLLCRPERSGIFPPHDDISWVQQHFNGNAMAIGMGAVPASLYAIGRIRKDSKMQRTALLAGEAMADAAIVQTVLKDATMRVRPTVYPPTFRLVCDQQLTDFLHTRKWKFSFRAQHRSVFCGHNHRPAIWKPSLGSFRRLWPGLACGIFTAHAQCSFLVGCLHGRRAWVFDQPLHCSPAIREAVNQQPSSIVIGGYRGTMASGSA